MKIINRIILVILLVWGIWIGYQYFTKSETANALLEKEVEELGYAGFSTLLQKMGKGYEYKEVQIDGQKYWIGWMIVRSGSVSKFIAFHIGKPRSRVYQKPGPAEIVNALEACIYVDYIDLLPFGYFKTGCSWVLAIKR